MARPTPAAALLALLAASSLLAAAAAREVTVSQCVWRNDVVCDASPAYIIAKVPSISSPSDNPLAVQVLQASAMEAACHVFSTQADCVAADACTWDSGLAPSCNVDANLLAQRDVFQSGCPGSLMEDYVRCGSAFNERECGRNGPNCVWYDELRQTPAISAKVAGGVASQSQRHLLGAQDALDAATGAAPSTAPRACMPKQLFALERRKDKEGTRRVMKQIASQDPAAWGDCAGVKALRSMIKTCTSFSSPGTCKARSPLCRWSDLVRSCITTGAGQAAWVLGSSGNSTEVADGAAACARASSKGGCAALGSITVDPKVFAAVQTGDFFVAAPASAAAGSRRVAARPAAPSFPSPPL
ncbi:MAG: hypothetical protein J3K34DRAFT_426899 [Monoraphidium minutum]|nr:MAG: hypothetical protein J3K34DRAFT_426899 [Monoraphidium minutum]